MFTPPQLLSHSPVESHSHYVDEKVEACVGEDAQAAGTEPRVGRLARASLGGSGQSSEF